MCDLGYFKDIFGRKDTFEGNGHVLGDGHVKECYIFIHFFYLDCFCFVAGEGLPYLDRPRGLYIICVNI